jgi:hypothetical protein
MYIVMYKSTQTLEHSYKHSDVQQYTESGAFLCQL